MLKIIFFDLKDIKIINDLFSWEVSLPIIIML